MLQMSVNRTSTWTEIYSVHCEQKQKFGVSSSVLCHQHNSAPLHSSLARPTQWQKYLLDPSMRRWPLSLARHDSLFIRGGLRDGLSLSVGELHSRNKWLEKGRKKPEVAATDELLLRQLLCASSAKLAIKLSSVQKLLRGQIDVRLQGHSVRLSGQSEVCSSTLLCFLSDQYQLIIMAEGHARSRSQKQINPGKTGRTRSLPPVYCQRGIQRILPSRPWGLVLAHGQTRWGWDNTAPSSKMDKTRGKGCPDIMGVNKRRAGGHSGHQFGRLTGAVTALTAES